jgi:hypothetical protein
MNRPNDKKSDWYFPPDMLAIFGMAVIPAIVVILMTCLITPLIRARSGDPTMLWVAGVLAGIGIVLLFFARLPLYRERRFFVIGPGALDQKHRRLYRWAYGLIGCSTLLLVLLLLVVR